MSIYKITNAQRASVIERLLRGYSWHRAVKESVLDIDAKKKNLRHVVFRFRSDPEIQKALLASGDVWEKTKVQDRNRLLLELEEALDIARDNDSAHTIGRLVMEKASLLGLDKHHDPDDFDREWERMSVDQRMTYLGQGLTRLEGLRKRLEERGLKVIENATSEVPQGQLSQGDGSV